LWIQTKILPAKDLAMIILQLFRYTNVKVLGFYNLANFPPNIAAPLARLVCETQSITKTDTTGTSEHRFCNGLAQLVPKYLATTLLWLIHQGSADQLFEYAVRLKPASDHDREDRDD
jgi:hypothetical protein